MQLNFYELNDLKLAVNLDMDFHIDLDMYMCRIANFLGLERFRVNITVIYCLKLMNHL